MRNSWTRSQHVWSSRGYIRRSSLFLAYCLVQKAFGFDGNFTEGNQLCPCLSQDQLAEIVPADLNDDTVAFFGEDMSVLPTYGVGCGQHDQISAECKSASCSADPNIIPRSPKCDRSFCDLNFCYIDPNNCQLMNRRSSIFPKSYRFYSYATCWDVDSFTAARRIASIEGRVFKVGFNSNSGGWQGAYSTEGKQFEGPVDLWKGPTVDFAVKGAERGKYQMNLTLPPPFLQNRSQMYFNSKSNFDYCVYATSLGYLDFCLAQYTITDQRAATTDWLVLGSQDLHLVVQFDDISSGWEKFFSQMRTIFLPFTGGVWVFLILFVVPCLGMMMIIHEYDEPGSAYPKTEEVLLQENHRPSSMYQVETRRVPFYRHIARSIYLSFLSVLQQTYVHSVVSYGAMLNLLGISFFILTIVAVYTANLAAILTQKAQKTTISSLADALSANYRICSERKNLETVKTLYPEIQDSFVALDPVEIGGDGLPGFNCPDCAARTRVFDFLDTKLAEKNPQYCQAAFAPLEDLEVEQRLGRHCNKTIIGTRVGSTQTGIPVNEKSSPELISWFLKLKNDGVFDRELITDKPEPQCPDFETGGQEGVSLNVAQLTGIWVVTFGFAISGLFVTWIQPKIQKRRAKSIKPVHLYDQNGQRINTLEKDDDWIDEKSIMKGSKRIYVGDSRWSKASRKAGGTKMSSTAFDVMSKRVGGSRNLNLDGMLDEDSGTTASLDVQGKYSMRPFGRPPVHSSMGRAEFGGSEFPALPRFQRSKSDEIGISHRNRQLNRQWTPDDQFQRQADHSGRATLGSLAEEQFEDLLLESSMVDLSLENKFSTDEDERVTTNRLEDTGGVKMRVNMAGIELFGEQEEEEIDLKSHEEQRGSTEEMTTDDLKDDSVNDQKDGKFGIEEYRTERYQTLMKRSESDPTIKVTPAMEEP